MRKLLWLSALIGRQIAGHAATIAKLQQAITAAERRAGLAEEAARRASKGFAAAGGRR